MTMFDFFQAIAWCVLVFFGACSIADLHDKAKTLWEEAERQQRLGHERDHRLADIERRVSCLENMRPEDWMVDQ